MIEPEATTSRLHEPLKSLSRSHTPRPTTGITAEMALRLAKAFDTTPESWLHHQLQHDLWVVRRSKKKLQVRVLAA